jgi:hypothetical protein
VSCAPAGSCTVGGSYTRRNGNGPGFVASERNGRWAKAIQVPGLTALDHGGDSGVISVSCPSAGSCAVGGNYAGRGNGDVFVASERHGRWGKAIRVPGMAALDKDRQAGVTSVSCGSAGSCAVGGVYGDRHHHSQGFVAVERHGRWGKAIAVPGLRALNTHGLAEVTSVSCAPPGSCAAGGYYFDRRHHAQWFVAVERHGHWAKAIQVPGLRALNKPNDTEVFPNYFSVACAPAGSCAAGGYYTDRHGHGQGFVTQAR